MTATNDVYARMTVIFRDVFDDDSIVLREDMTADDLDNWDSLSHVDLVLAIEKEFRIRLTTGEISGLKSVGQLAALVSHKLVGSKDLRSGTVRE
jgi:acyl carrier protein